MKKFWLAGNLFLVSVIAASCLTAFADDPTNPISKVPRFSISYMDKSVSPTNDFYHYAAGTWLRENPVPADKSRWAGFDELQQRNWQLIRDILESAARDTNGPIKSPRREVGDFYASAINTNRINDLGIAPLKNVFARIEAIATTEQLMKVLADLQMEGLNVMFGVDVSPDEKDSSTYALHLGQGGLGLPDRDYYLTDAFAKKRTNYVAHIDKMFVLAGDNKDYAESRAEGILSLETAMAKASKAREDLRDPVANYHKFPLEEIIGVYPALSLNTFLKASGISNVTEVIVGQPEYFEALDKLVKDRPLDDWKIYLRWHVLHHYAAFLSTPFETESFAFYGTQLRGTPEMEPRWQRGARRVDSYLGEALGQIFVEKYFPPAARARMEELIANLKAVLHDRLEKLEWMTDPTRAKAIIKFDAFTQKIGFPKKFRDYSSVVLHRDDYLGNVARLSIFESKRQLARLGKPVDKTEWQMTPQTVNAYFDPTQNEIVFPAGILQPPFFDVKMDDAVNYGAIGVVIGHEMTHCYDDEGRQYDEKGNLADWWTKDDAKAFEGRAQKLVDQFNGYEILPGVHVNGKLTLGENIADLGGTSIAFEAMERALAENPSKRKVIDGFTPEQRFYLSFAQVWRTNAREDETRQRIVTDPHSPGQLRSIGALVNQQSFFDAFNIKEGAPMWRSPDVRAVIW